MVSEFQQKFQNDPQVYFNRSVLIQSLEKRDVELITITSHKNKLPDQEKQALFHVQNANLPFQFKQKKYIFLSARVHPGEIPGSHVLNGVFKQLLNKNDERTQILLDNFVFYIVPIINPDGVYRGHYRTDTQGLNLNRFYINPSIQEHPSVYAVKELIMHLSETKRLHSYIDLHAHATKKGCFMYGNCVDLKNQLSTCLFPRLISLNSPYFEYESCNFTEKNMYCKDKGDGLSKEGAGRVALYKATKINLCYTLECNYNIGSQTNLVSANSMQQQTSVSSLDEKEYEKDIIFKSIETPNSKPCQFYTPEIFQQVGEALCDAFLDYNSLHPSSRIPNTVYQSLQTLKMKMAFNLLKMQPFRYCSYMRKVFRFLTLQGDNVDRVLRCLWIYINTGIKNDLEGTKTILKNDKRNLNQSKNNQNLTKNELNDDKNVDFSQKRPQSKTGVQTESKQKEIQRNKEVNICIEKEKLDNSFFLQKQKKQNKEELAKKGGFQGLKQQNLYGGEYKGFYVKQKRIIIDALSKNQNQVRSESMKSQNKKCKNKNIRMFSKQKRI